jgi:heat shock protein HslJ
MWELTSLGPTAIPESEQQNYTAQFGSDGQLNIRADCNTCFGNYETSGNLITIGTLGCTRAACGEDSLFDEYVSSVAGASSFVRRGDTLELNSAGGALIYEVAR